jgi:hypothetical protein
VHITCHIDENVERAEFLADLLREGVDGIGRENVERRNLHGAEAF